MKKVFVVALVFSLGLVSFAEFAMQQVCEGSEPNDADVEMDVRASQMVSTSHRTGDGRIADISQADDIRLEGFNMLEYSERLRQENKRLREVVAQYETQRQEGVTLTENELKELKGAQQQLKDLLGQHSESMGNAKESASAQGSFETETDIRCCNCGKVSTRCSCSGKTAAKFATVGGAGAAVGAVVATAGGCNIL